MTNYFSGNRNCNYLGYRNSIDVIYFPDVLLFPEYLWMELPNRQKSLFKNHVIFALSITVFEIFES